LIQNNFICSRDICIDAIKHNRLDVLKLLLHNGSKYDDILFYTACEFGNCEILELFQVNGFIERCNLRKIGNIKTLKWLTKNNFRLNKNIFKHAAKSGHLNMMKWLKEN